MVILAVVLGSACSKTRSAGPRAGVGGAPTAGGPDAAPLSDARPDAAVAASFDCKKAATNIERLICASPTLSDLDGRVAIAFKEALRGYLDPKMLRNDQRDWLLVTRNKAPTEAELSTALTERLARLRESIEGSKEVVRGALAWRMMTSAHDAEVALPVITRWRNAKVKARINDALTELASKMGCAPQAAAEGDAPSEYSMSAVVTYAEDDIFSIEIHSQYFCAGAAHGENDDNSSVTFDLRTGDQVGFGELFANYEKDRVAILKTVFGEDITHKESADDEVTLENIVAYGLAFSFHDDGLHVTPTFPHVFANAAEQSTTPYAELKPFAARKGPLARIKN
jgi:uncharacterized protein